MALGDLPDPTSAQLARMTAGMSAGARAAFEARTAKGKILRSVKAARKLGTKAKGGGGGAG